MYTGIVQGAFSLASIERRSGLHSLQIDLPEALLEDLTIGASVAMDGVCLTVTHIAGARVSFDVMQQTLEVTTLGELEPGARVNIERSAKQGAEVGGHLLSGHIDARAVICQIETPDNNHFVTYQVDPSWMKYIFNKGFIALNGCSLTVADVDRAQSTFTVCYIPETLRVTTHGEKQIGDSVNFEIDRQTQTIVDTVENVLQSNPDWLAQVLQR